MRRPSNNYRVRAYMFDDAENRTYEVVEDSEGLIWVRDTRVGSPWQQTTVHPKNHRLPTLANYLQSCEDNFGWRIENAGL